LNGTNADVEASGRFATRGGDKLAFALAAFALDVHGRVCADLGSHIGGFVDCLLQAGAARVYSVDTSYGTLDWRLRNDPRVVVLERTNALHVALPELVDLVTIDVAWTRQTHVLPAARRLVKPDGWVLSLVKPQYEAERPERHKGVVRPECLVAVVNRVWADLATAGLSPVAVACSPLPGGAGNVEFFALFPAA
jgi:23S rRNA (cytidine1920-2'-O)/16S rRNA (cytidine1409-2'-O)-methyltransferase